MATTGGSSKEFTALGLCQKHAMSIIQCRRGLEERVDSGTDAEIQFVWNLDYVDDLLLRDRDTNSNGTLDERLYSLPDLRFCVMALADTSGAVVERFKYEVYGQSQAMTALFVDRSSSSYDWEFRYTGRREDLETGLLFFRARFYHAQLGRFISRDPIGFVDGMSLYRAYFVPDGVDPSGLFIRILQDGPLGPISSSWPAVYPGAVKPATEKPKPPVKNVQVCCAGIDLIPGPIKEQAEALGGVHCWLRTPKKAGGLYAHPNDQTADGGLPASPCYGTETVIWDHQNPTDWAEDIKLNVSKYQIAAQLASRARGVRNEYGRMEPNLSMPGFC